MALPTIFGLETAATGGQLDVNFGIVGSLGAIPCTVAGTNTLVLTPQANTPTIAAYANYMRFSGIVAVTSTGTVNASVAPLGTLPVYIDTASGPTAAGSGNLIAGNALSLTYDSALNSGAGGFHAGSAGSSNGAQIVGTPTAGHSAIWASSTTLEDGGAAPTLGVATFTSSGTFTTPANTLLTTVFKFTLIGGGGGTYTGANLASGGAGAAIYAWVSGFSPSQANTITLGAGGTNSATSPTAGSSTVITLTTNTGTVTLTAGGGGPASSSNGGLGGNPSHSGTVVAIFNIAGGAGQTTGNPPPSTTVAVPPGTSIFGGSFGAGNLTGGGSGAAYVEWIL